MKKAIFTIILLIGIVPLKGVAGHYMRHYPELSIHSRVELKVAAGGRVLDAFIYFYKDPYNRGASVGCINGFDLQVARAVESAVYTLDYSVQVFTDYKACYRF